MVNKLSSRFLYQNIINDIENAINHFINRSNNSVIFRHKGNIFLFTAVLFGIIVRLIHLAFVGFEFPYKYGGLFFEISQQIAGNHLLLPNHIPFYTDNGIPFAYPPLAFYIEALLINILSFPKFLVVNLLPPIISIFALLIFILLVDQLKLDLTSKIISILAFGLMPSSFSELIEGGGLAEAFGCFSLIFLAYVLLRTKKLSIIKKSLIIGIAWALCIVASPGSAYASVPTIVVFMLASDFQRLKEKIISVTFSLFFTLLFSSLYWVPVIRNHGLSVFINSFLFQHPSNIKQVIVSFYKLIEFNWSGVFLWSFLIFLGFTISIFRKRWLLPFWYIFIILIPKESSWLTAIPASLLAGQGASFGLSLLNKWGNNYQKSIQKIVFYSIIGLTFFINSVYPVILKVKENIEDHKNGISPAFMVMTEWIRNYTSPNSKYIVLSSNQVSEWFPTIAQRTVLNIPYGSEWEPDERKIIYLLRSQLDNCYSIQCVFSNTKEIIGYTNYFIVIQKDYWERYGILDNHNLDILWKNEEYAVLQIIDSP